MTDRQVSIDEELVLAAQEARLNAYAGYSNFQVGSAVRGGTGRIFVGANVENASYGLTICAERVAIFSAITAGERSIRGIAVVTGADGVTPPCGACRQVLLEFGPNATIYGANLAGDRAVWSATELLPYAFDSTALGVHVGDEAKD
jgi:cytidine deaminase